MNADTGKFLPGTLEMLILRTLSRRPLHGYGIAEAIRTISEDALKVGEGSLYPALQRLLPDEYVKPDRGLSDNKRRARIYIITPAGRKHLDHRWHSPSAEGEMRIRALRRARLGAEPRGFAAIVIVTIGLALGLNTALFTAFDHYLLRPLAVRDPDSLHQVSGPRSLEACIHLGRVPEDLGAVRLR